MPMHQRRMTSCSTPLPQTRPGVGMNDIGLSGGLLPKVKIESTLRGHPGGIRLSWVSGPPGPSWESPCQRESGARRFQGQLSAGPRAGEGLPSSRRHHPKVPRPIRRGVPHGCTSRVFTASMAFAPVSRARHSLHPPRKGGPITTPQASLHATDRSVASPARAFDTGLRRRAFPPDAASLLRASWQLPGPDFHRQVTTS
jgi:hypothetical protein